MGFGDNVLFRIPALHFITGYIHFQNEKKKQLPIRVEQDFPDDELRDE